MDFLEVEKQLQSNFKKMSSSERLYYVELNRDEVVEKYLSAFPIRYLQENTCNCCKSFIRQFGGIVSIDGNNVVSIWDNIEADEEYSASIKALSEYIHSLPITDVFLVKESKLGTKQAGGFNHFYLDNDRKFMNNYPDKVKGELRTQFQTLKRALDELSKDSVDTVLEFIETGVLYRGNEYKGIVVEFSKLKNQYETLSDDKAKILFSWKNSTNPVVSKIRNTAIGTLLVDLSEGLDEEQAVSKYERVVAPTNYKRTSSLATPKQIEAAKKDLQEKGLLGSLQRRKAISTDIPVANSIFLDRSSNIKDVFEELASVSKVDPKAFSKSKEIGISDFIENVIPNFDKVEVLLENSHLNNFVSITAPVNAEDPSLFKWNNSIAWSYTGGITDSLKERVKDAGGNVEGVLRFSIQWNDEETKASCDLDAHAVEPNHTHIYYSSGYRKDRGNGKTSMSGQLDVDMISPRGIGVENIVWTDLSKMKEGVYQFKIHNFSGRNSGVRAQIEFDGQIFDFVHLKSFDGYLPIAEVTYSKAKGFSIVSKLDSKSNISTKEKWNLRTAEFVKVKSLFLSPNYWEDNGTENGSGNKHYMFMLEGCKSDETVKPFFNEFLRNDMLIHKKSFEMLSSKIKVEEVENELSGIGFSDTIRKTIIVRCTSNKSKETYRVNILNPKL